MNLVGAGQRLVDAAHHVRHAVGRIQGLVGIHLSRVVGVGRNLPATEVNGLQAGAHLLHRLVAGQRAKRRDIGFRMQQFPEPLRASARQGMLDRQRTAQLLDVLLGVRPGDALPAGIGSPIVFQGVVVAICAHRYPSHPYPSNRGRNNAVSGSECGSGTPISQTNCRYRRDRLWLSGLLVRRRGWNEVSEGFSP